MLIKIPYYSSSLLLDREQSSLFPVVTFRNKKHVTAREIRQLLTDNYKYEYVYEVSIDRSEAISEKDRNSLFTIFLPNKGDCQIKKLKIYLSREKISFEAVCPRMIPVSHPSIIRLMDKQEQLIQEFWKTLVKDFYSGGKNQTGIGIVQNELDKPLIELANYIYSFSEINSASDFIKSLVGENVYEHPTFNYELIEGKLNLSFDSGYFNNFLKVLYKRRIICDKIPFYANVSENENIVYGTFGWPYEDERNLLDARNKQSLRNFQDWETCIDVLFYNMALLSSQGERIYFGYTTSSIANYVMKFSSAIFKNLYPLSSQSWIDLRLYENAITCRYIIDQSVHRWCLVYQPNKKHSTPLIRLAKLINLTNSIFNKEIDKKDYTKYSNKDFWNSILSVIFYNIKSPTLSAVLNTELEFGKWQHVIVKETKHWLLWYVIQSGMLIDSYNTLKVDSSIKNFIPEDNEFNRQVRELLHEIFTTASENNVSLNDLPSVTNYYLSNVIDFSESELIIQKLKDTLSDDIFDEIKEEENISVNSAQSLLDYNTDLCMYQIGFDYSKFKSKFINITDEKKIEISSYQENIIRGLISINILLGLYRLHKTDMVISYLKSIYPETLKVVLKLKPFEEYLTDHQNVIDKNIVIDFIKKLLKLS